MTPRHLLSIKMIPDQWFKRCIAILILILSGCTVEFNAPAVKVGDETDSETDLCPDDPNKTESGVCGCGTPDVDGDSDGTHDCVDHCALDPDKTERGVCGCGSLETDGDSDGTPDCLDDCVDDPNKIEPGICGCGAIEEIKDADGDSVVDCLDDCVDDRYKTEPGVCGCGVTEDVSDVDSDSVVDCLDICLSDPKKDDPGVCGCGIADSDGDGDGTPDCLDSCASDSSKTEPGICGCGVSETDGDGDGTADCNDNCAADPNKTKPGICGCGNLDSDSDGDGTPDCLDSCSEDSEKTVPGNCGCGNPDIDSDGDGVLDCVDNCPSDSNKTEPGDCGCGVLDTDGDGDGTVDCNDECPNDPSGTINSDWYPDCDGDGAYSSSATNACGISGADAASNCDDGEAPDGGWSAAAGSDCYDEEVNKKCVCGEQDNDGDGNCMPVSNLKDADGAASGLMDFELATGTMPLYVDGDYDSGGWVLIGRGREGWAWTESGIGDPTTLSTSLGTPAAFLPQYLSSSIVQELIDNTGVDLTEVDIRVKRAAGIDGSTYVESIWRSRENPEWTWLFDTMQYEINYSVLSSVLGAGMTSVENTRDAGNPNNDHRRTFTWDWDGHNYLGGFSYGAAMSTGTDDPNNFLWQFGTEAHSIPYSEVYIRYSNRASCLEILNGNPSASDGMYYIDPDGPGAADPFLVTCDITGGGWTIIYTEDFVSGDSSGWENGSGVATPVDSSSSCATAYGSMLGGYEQLGVNAQTVQTFELLGIPHTEVSVALDYVVIDSWDGEAALVYVDEVELYREAFNTSDVAENVCGGAWADHGPQPVAVQSAHSADTATVRVTSTLDQSPDDESFGVDNFVIKVR